MESMKYEGPRNENENKELQIITEIYKRRPSCGAFTTFAIKAYVAIQFQGYKCLSATEVRKMESDLWR